MNKFETQTPKLNFSIKDTQPVTCTDCKGQVFSNGMILRKVSKIIAGTDKDALIPVNIPYCVNCMQVLEDLLPSELKSDNKITLV